MARRSDGAKRRKLMLSVGAPLVAMIGIALAVGASAQTPDPAKWADIQRKAKAEGQVVLMGPPAAGLRTGLMTAFKNRYGIELNYLGINAGKAIARIDTEEKAGQVNTDIYLGGTSSCWAMSPRGEIENMN